MTGEVPGQEGDLKNPPGTGHGGPLPWDGVAALAHAIHKNTNKGWFGR